MTLNTRQSETLRDIRYLEMNGHGRVINADEAQELCNLELVEKEAGLEPSYRLTPRGREVLKIAEERLSLLVSL